MGRTDNRGQSSLLSQVSCFWNKPQASFLVSFSATARRPLSGPTLEQGNGSDWSETCPLVGNELCWTTVVSFSSSRDNVQKYMLPRLLISVSAVEMERVRTRILDSPLPLRTDRPRGQPRSPTTRGQPGIWWKPFKDRNSDSMPAAPPCRS